MKNRRNQGSNPAAYSNGLQNENQSASFDEDLRTPRLHGASSINNGGNGAKDFTGVPNLHHSDSCNDSSSSREVLCSKSNLGTQGKVKPTTSSSSDTFARSDFFSFFSTSNKGKFKRRDSNIFTPNDEEEEKEEETRILNPSYIQHQIENKDEFAPPLTSIWKQNRSIGPSSTSNTASNNERRYCIKDDYSPSTTQRSKLRNEEGIALKDLAAQSNSSNRNSLKDVGDGDGDVGPKGVEHEERGESLMGLKKEVLHNLRSKLNNIDGFHQKLMDCVLSSDHEVEEHGENDHATSMNSTVPLSSEKSNRHVLLIGIMVAFAVAFCLCFVALVVLESYHRPLMQSPLETESNESNRIRMIEVYNKEGDNHPINLTIIPPPYNNQENEDELAPMQTIESLFKEKSYARQTIVNGYSIVNSQEEYPYVVSLLKRNHMKRQAWHTCGGIMITPNVILTAAHCYSSVHIAHIGLSRADHQIRKRRAARKLARQEERILPEIIYEEEYERNENDGLDDDDDDDDDDEYLSFLDSFNDDDYVYNGTNEEDRKSDGEKFLPSFFSLAKLKRSLYSSTVELNKLKNPHSFGKAYSIRYWDKIKHPDFNPSTGENDIMLIKLPAWDEQVATVRINFNPSVPNQNLYEPVVVLGWGVTKPDDNDSVSEFLNRAPLFSVSNTICEELYKQLYKPPIIRDSMICAHSLNGRDACRGDSGGPLIKEHPDDPSQDVALGVVSWGESCGNKQYPGVYARISEAHEWITDTVCNVLSPQSCHFGQIKDTYHVQQQMDENYQCKDQVGILPRSRYRSCAWVKRYSWFGCLLYEDECPATCNAC